MEESMLECELEMVAILVLCGKKRIKILGE